MCGGVCTQVVVLRVCVSVCSVPKPYWCVCMGPARTSAKLLTTGRQSQWAAPAWHDRCPPVLACSCPRRTSEYIGNRARVLLFGARTGFTRMWWRWIAEKTCWHRPVCAGGGLRVGGSKKLGSRWCGTAHASASAQTGRCTSRLHAWRPEADVDWSRLSTAFRELEVGVSMARTAQELF